MLYEVITHEIQTKGEVVLDDELAKKMLPGQENADMAMLREKVKEQLESEALSKLYNEELKPNLLNTFVETFQFDLPSFVVEQEMDMALNKHAQGLSQEELEALRNDQDKVKELRETVITSYSIHYTKLYESG